MEKVKVVLGSAVTWLVAVGAVVSIVLSELEPFRGVPYVGAVLNVGAVVLTIIGVIVRIIQRSTPVLPSARGLLPVTDGKPVTLQEKLLRSRVTDLERIVPRR